MNKLMTATAVLALSAGGALAGGIDRNGQPIGIIFEDTGDTGSYFTFSFGNVNPSATGTAGATTVNDPLGSYRQIGFGFKQDISDALSVSLFYDQPFGASVSYDSGVPFFGGKAEISSDALNVIGRYEMGNGFSVHGGLRALQVGGEIFTLFDGGAVPALLEADSKTGLGGVIGAAYEIPDIALRLAVTYSSEINLDFEGTESTLSGLDPAFPAAASADSEFEMTFPESINIDFQTGVAADTLVFGSVRWVGWDGFNLTTDGAGLGRGDSEYVNFEGDTTTYSLGVGRRLNDMMSVAVSYTYEDRGDEPSTTALAPTTGIQAVNVGGTFNLSDNTTLTAGFTIGTPGDQIVENGVVGDVDFDDNMVVGAGFRIGTRF